MASFLIGIVRACDEPPFLIEVKKNLHKSDLFSCSTSSVFSQLFVELSESSDL